MFVRVRNKERKKPTRKFNTNHIKQGVCYSADDLHNDFGVDKSCVNRWEREEGLIAIDNKQPAMFHWQTLRQFLDYKNSSRKFPKGKEGEIACMRCRLKRRPFKDEVVITKKTKSLLKLQALCECCGLKMNDTKNSACEMQMVITWGYKVVETLPKFVKSNKQFIQRKDIPKPKFELQNPVKFNPINERLKYKYYDRVINLEGWNEKTLNQIRGSMNAFDNFTNHADYQEFNFETAKSFVKEISKDKSINTIYRTLKNVQGFFKWLKEQDGYKKAIDMDCIKALRLKEKDKEKINFTEPKEIIPLEEMEAVAMDFKPTNEMEARSQVLLVFLLVGNGIRIESALETTIEDLNLRQGFVFQRNPKTGRPQRTDLLKFKPELFEILINWVDLLKNQYHFTEKDPLFPAVQRTLNGEFEFEKNGYKKEFIQPNAVREDLDKLFEGYHFTPHAVRYSLTYFFFECEINIEQQKAFSQNLGHKDLFTTTNSYYSIPEQKKTQIMKKFDIEEMKARNKARELPEYNYIMSYISNAEKVKKLFNLIAVADKS